MHRRPRGYVHKHTATVHGPIPDARRGRELVAYAYDFDARRRGIGERGAVATDKESVQRGRSHLKGTSFSDGRVAPLKRVAVLQCVGGLGRRRTGEVGEGDFTQPMAGGRLS